MIESPAALRGGKGYRDPNTKKTHKKEKDGRYFGGFASLQGYRGPTWQSTEKKRSSLEFGDAVRAERHRRRSGYNTKVERLGARSPSIGGGIVKYKHI